MAALAWIIFWVPFVVAALIFFFALKPRVAGLLATGGMFTAFALTLLLLAKFSSAHVPSVESALVWMAAGSVPIEFGVLINGLTILMLLIVTGIGSLIFLYSMAYMEKDPGFTRYFASLSLFAFSMLGIVLSNNFIQIFIFWELVGLSSYLLIGFWFEKPEASTASKKAFLTTRVGDVGMMIGILMIFGFLMKQGLGTFNFLALEQQLPQASIPSAAMTAIALLVFMGVAGKSAQVPLHVWLPDAMEGPTPVSALMHAATMVAAGVFLLARVSFLFNMSPDALQIIAWIGGITALIAGTIAIAQQDVKKILAYSTLSQLGYMVMALGLKNTEAGMFHLATHAFFKALLFLGSGSLIHSLHTQNIWEMQKEKGLLSIMPVTGWTFLIGTAALMGIPPLSGFYSKEEVLAAAQHGPQLLFIIALAVVFCTSFYMGRLCTIVFFRKVHDAHSHASKGHGDPHGHHEPHESGWQMAVPLIILAVFSVIAGFLPIKQLLASGTHGHHTAHHGGGFLQYLSIGLAVSGFAIAFLLYSRKKSEADEFKGPLAGIKKVLGNKYFIDDFYDNVVIKGVQENIAKVSDWFERIVVVEAGVNGTARLTRGAGDILRKLQTGMVQFYALVFAAGFTVILYIFMLVRS